MTKPTIHLVCQAHLDPVWLWEWEEGAAEVISTFRTAADLCEEFDSFVFNHNEVVLYEWVEEYEPELFRRIQRLVSESRWHIMGGWYLQPDCNMPSGESFVRQMLVGRAYFLEKFGVAPTTAVNFDPFGHTRGLVQLMVKSGYDSYVFCRPGPGDRPLPDNDFVWVGFDGSEIDARRPLGGYNSPLGKAREKVERHLIGDELSAHVLVLWGVGNHGGGPSRQDLRRLAELIAERDDVDIIHSTPEAYFAARRSSRQDIPRHDKDLNPWAVGCYTSQIRIKQLHRHLENELYSTEKMAATAALQGLMAYPKDDIAAAQRDLLLAEFHDILPGSSIQPVEDTSIRLMNHALEILSKVKARSFFRLAAGQPRARENEIPVLVYNPHPYTIADSVECEFQLADQNWEDSITIPTAFRGETAIPTQLEKEASNLNLDWRKRIVIHADLAPGMNRFDCRLKTVPKTPQEETTDDVRTIEFETRELAVTISRETGLIDRLCIYGNPMVKPGSCQPLVIRDDEDPWGMRVHSFRDVEGAFRLMTPERSAGFSGVKDKEPVLQPVRIVEDGPVRMVVEAVFEYGDSAICQQYILPRHGTAVEIRCRVFWNEKNRMLKLAVQTPWTDGIFRGQVAFGNQDLPRNGDEAVAQKWISVSSADREQTLLVMNNGTYASDFCDGELRLSLLRSPAYSGHPIKDRPVVPLDRFTPRIDQGERIFTFWLTGGHAENVLEQADQLALAKNERPFALSFFPSAIGCPPAPGILLSDPSVIMSTFKQAEDGIGFIVRLFEPTGKERNVDVTVPALDAVLTISLSPYEVKTLRLKIEGEIFVETDLMEGLLTRLKQSVQAG